MMEQEKITLLAPLACRWAKAQEQFILQHGAPLGERQKADALLVGVQDAARVRVLVVDRIPLPDHKELAEAAQGARNANAAAAWNRSWKYISPTACKAAISGSVRSRRKPARGPGKSAPVGFSSNRRGALAIRRSSDR